MKKIFFILLSSLVCIGCSHRPSFDNGESKTEITGEVVMYTQRTF